MAALGWGGLHSWRAHQQAKLAQPSLPNPVKHAPIFTAPQQPAAPDEHAPRPHGDADKSGERSKTIAAATPRHLQPHRSPTAPPVPAPPRRFELAPTPKAVSVILDGKALGDYGPQLEHVDIPAGRHTVRFESPYCFPRDVVIEEGAPAGRIATRLRWKPARLTVKAEPDSADVLVDGSILRSGQPIDVLIPELSDGKKLVRVKVAAAGFQSAEREIELRANDAKVEHIALRSSEQP
jgi:hypothetical protein